MSVGHVARLFEEAGIATVVVAIRPYENRIKMMSLPRALLTPHLMGRPLGAPGDRETQLKVIRHALNMLETAEKGGTIEHFPGAYRPVKS